MCGVSTINFPGRPYLFVYTTTNRWEIPSCHPLRTTRRQLTTGFKIVLDRLLEYTETGRPGNSIERSFVCWKSLSLFIENILLIENSTLDR